VSRQRARALSRGGAPLSCDGGDHYYEELAAAFVRGRLGSAVAAGADAETLSARGPAAGLRLPKLERAAEPPRVRKVLGLLRAMAPQSLRAARVAAGAGRVSAGSAAASSVEVARFFFGVRRRCSDGGQL
jgi:hypothetical protein